MAPLTPEIQFLQRELVEILDTTAIGLYEHSVKISRSQSVEDLTAAGLDCWQFLHDFSEKIEKIGDAFSKLG